MRNGTKRTSRPTDKGIKTLDLDPRLDNCSSKAQKLAALAAANDVRMARAKIRRELYAGEYDFDELLDEMPKCCARMPVLKILLWLPNVGRTKAKRILGFLDIHHDTRLSELRARQKYDLSKFAHEHMDGYRGRVTA